MTDRPQQAIETMRHQLRILLEYDDERLEAVRTVDEKAGLAALDLPQEDHDLFHRLSAGQRDALFAVDRADAKVVQEMSDQIQLLGPSEYSTHRHEFLLRRAFTLAKEVGGLADALDDRDAAERIVQHINTAKNGSPETNKDYRTAFRTFGDLVTDGDGPPESIAWIPGGYPKNYDPAPRPEKMFKWDEHIVPMLDACHNSRDRALIALAWDLGPRPGELFDLTLNRFSDHQYGLKVTLHEGKQGTRSPILVPSVPYVQQWREDHPASADADAPLWSKLTETDAISNNRIRDVFKERARAADMTPPSTPTPSRMRKSSASHLASQSDVSQAHLEDHHGWGRGSQVAARYIAVFADANDRAIAAAHGVDVEDDEPEPAGPVECKRCGQATPRHKDRCIYCGQARSQAAVEEAEALQQAGYRAVGELIQEHGLDGGDAASLIDRAVSQQVDAILDERGLGDHADSSSD